MMLCCGKNTLRGISNKLHAAWGIHSHRGFAGWRDLLLLLCASSTLCRFCHQFPCWIANFLRYDNGERLHWIWTVSLCLLRCLVPFWTHLHDLSFSVHAQSVLRLRHFALLFLLDLRHADDHGQSRALHWH